MTNTLLRPVQFPHLIAYLDAVLLAAVASFGALGFGVSIIFAPVFLLTLYSLRLYEIPVLFVFWRNLLALFVASCLSSAFTLLIFRETPIAAFLTVLATTSALLYVSHTLVGKPLYSGTKFLVLRAPHKGEEELATIFDEIERRTLRKVRFRGRSRDRRHPDGYVLSGYSVRLRKNGIRKANSVLASLPELCETSLRRIPVELVERYPDYYADYFPARTRNDLPKYVFDLFLAVAVLVLTLPVVIVVALAIYLEDGSPVVFTQFRIGRNGLPFTIYKFRSLKNETAGSGDPNHGIERRALRIGRFIRRTRIDEILNFINVIGGSMSAVGPRPEMPVYHERAVGSIPGYEYRLLVKPGISGWAQINYPHSSTVDEYRRKTSYDLYYVKHRNLFFDLRIILKTLESIVSMRGSR